MNRTFPAVLLPTRRRGMTAAAQPDPAAPGTALDFMCAPPGNRVAVLPTGRGRGARPGVARGEIGV